MITGKSSGGNAGEKAEETRTSGSTWRDDDDDDSKCAESEDGGEGDGGESGQCTSLHANALITRHADAAVILSPLLSPLVSALPSYTSLHSACLPASTGIPLSTTDDHQTP